MKKLKLSTQNKNRIIAAIIGIIGCVALSLLFDLFYDMNDDVFMKNILSGIYTGKPEGHNIQMLYPLAFIISIFYKIVPFVPWYGLFLTGCMLLSFYLCLTRGLNHIQKKTEKTIFAITLVILYAGLLLWEMVFVQYTVVCGVLAATAAILLLLTPKDITRREFIEQNIISIALVVIAFNIRTEMLLLMAPFLALAGILRWSYELKPLIKDNLIKYGTIVGSILALLLISLAINGIAYSSEEWKEFNAFFDARTSVYDFTWYPDYEENTEFYEKTGISEGQYNLIDNYNFGLDDEINAEMLNQIAQYQTEKKNSETDIAVKLKTTVKNCIYQMKQFNLSTQHETRQMPYNALVVLLYIWLIILVIMKKDRSGLWKIPFMWICRSIPWLYILWKGRVVARLTHPMYFIEIMILCVYVFTIIRNSKQDNKTTRLSTYTNVIFICLMMFIIGITIPGSITTAKTEQINREKINQTDLALKQYCKEHAENFYYVDVYSTVAFSEKIFDNTETQATNYDILGGWLSKSLLNHEKELQHGITNIETDLVEKENIYFMAEEDSDISWLTTYYEEKGKKITIENVDKLNSDLIINIYRIRESR